MDHPADGQFAEVGDRRTPTRRRRSTQHVSHAVALWGGATALATTLYGIADSAFIPRFIIVLGIVGAMVATFSYLATEFTLRPVAAQALEAGPAPRRLAPGILGRIMTVWMLGSGLPVIGVGLIAFFVLLLENLTLREFAVAVLDGSMPGMSM